METQTGRKLSPSPVVAGTPPYKVPKHPAPIVLKLDQNEGEALSAEQFGELLSRLTPDLIRRYPNASRLEALIASRVGVEPEQIIVTAGADDSLDRACRMMIMPGRRILMTDPSFEMIRRYARLMGGVVDEVPWPKGAFPMDEFLAKVTPDTAVLAVVSPNNPTGTVVTRDELARIREAAPDALLLLDHAYVEFADEDLTDFALTLPNTVVVRTLSKAWGLAGLRVGYTISTPEIIGWMRVAGSPYNVSWTSIILAASRLESDQGESARFISAVKDERSRLQQLLDSLGIDRTDSHGNFVFPSSPRASWLRDALAGLGISCRIYPMNPGMENCLRLSMPGNEEEYAFVEHAVRAALSPKQIVYTATASEEARSALTRVCSAARIDAGLIPDSPRRGSVSGWGICGSDDDIERFRAQWIVPIVIREAAAIAGTEDELLAKGAARVLRRIDDLKEILP